MGLLILGIFLLVYGVFVLILAFTKKPAAIWNMGKIQGFVKMLGNTGTVIFFTIWGLATLGIGIWLTFIR